MSSPNSVFSNDSNHITLTSLDSKQGLNSEKINPNALVSLDEKDKNNKNNNLTNLDPIITPPRIQIKQNSLSNSSSPSISSSEQKSNKNSPGSDSNSTLFNLSPSKEMPSSNYSSSCFMTPIRINENTIVDHTKENNPTENTNTKLFQNSSIEDKNQNENTKINNKIDNENNNENSITISNANSNINQSTNQITCTDSNSNPNKNENENRNKNPNLKLNEKEKENENENENENPMITYSSIENISPSSHLPINHNLSAQAHSFSDSLFSNKENDIKDISFSSFKNNEHSLANISFSSNDFLASLNIPPDATATPASILHNSKKSNHIDPLSFTTTGFDNKSNSKIFDVFYSSQNNQNSSSISSDSSKFTKEMKQKENQKENTDLLYPTSLLTPDNSLDASLMSHNQSNFQNSFASAEFNLSDNSLPFSTSTSTTTDILGGTRLCPEIASISVADASSIIQEAVEKFMPETPAARALRMRNAYGSILRDPMCPVKDIDSYMAYLSRQRQDTTSETDFVWSPDVEAAFMEALRVVPKVGRRKITSNGRKCGRNELISDYIFQKTGKIRSRKQVSSHIQVLKHLLKNDLEFISLVSDSLVYSSATSPKNTGDVSSSNSSNTVDHQNSFTGTTPFPATTPSSSSTSVDLTSSSLTAAAMAYQKNNYNTSMSSSPFHDTTSPLTHANSNHQYLSNSNSLISPVNFKSSNSHLKLSNSPDSPDLSYNKYYNSNKFSNGNNTANKSSDLHIPTRNEFFECPEEEKLDESVFKSCPIYPCQFKVSAQGSSHIYSKLNSAPVANFFIFDHHTISRILSKFVDFKRRLPYLINDHRIPAYHMTIGFALPNILQEPENILAIPSLKLKVKSFRSMLNLNSKNTFLETTNPEYYHNDNVNKNLKTKSDTLTNPIKKEIDNETFNPSFNAEFSNGISKDEMDYDPIDLFTDHSWEVVTKVYTMGKCVLELTEPVEIVHTSTTKKESDESENSENTDNEEKVETLNIPWASEFWAHFFLGLDRSRKTFYKNHDIDHASIKNAKKNKNAHILELVNKKDRENILAINQLQMYQELILHSSTEVAVPQPPPSFSPNDKSNNSSASTNSTKSHTKKPTVKVENSSIRAVFMYEFTKVDAPGITNLREISTSPLVLKNLENQNGVKVEETSLFTSSYPAVPAHSEHGVMERSKSYSYSPYKNLPDKKRKLYQSPVKSMKRSYSAFGGCSPLSSNKNVSNSSFVLNDDQFDSAPLSAPLRSLDSYFTQMQTPSNNNNSASDSNSFSNGLGMFTPESSSQKPGKKNDTNPNMANSQGEKSSSVQNSKSHSKNMNALLTTPTHNNDFGFDIFSTSSDSSTLRGNYTNSMPSTSPIKHHSDDQVMKLNDTDQSTDKVQDKSNFSNEKDDRNSFKDLEKNKRRKKNNSSTSHSAPILARSQSYSGTSHSRSKFFTNRKSNAMTGNFGRTDDIHSMLDVIPDDLSYTDLDGDNSKSDAFKIFSPNEMQNHNGQKFKPSHSFDDLDLLTADPDSFIQSDGTAIHNNRMLSFDDSIAQLKHNESMHSNDLSLDNQDGLTGEGSHFMARSISQNVFGDYTTAIIPSSMPDLLSNNFGLRDFELEEDQMICPETLFPSSLTNNAVNTNDTDLNDASKKDESFKNNTSKSDLYCQEKASSDFHSRQQSSQSRNNESNNSNSSYLQCQSPSVLNIHANQTNVASISSSSPSSGLNIREICGFDSGKENDPEYHNHLGHNQENIMKWANNDESIHHGLDADDHFLYESKLSKESDNIHSDDTISAKYSDSANDMTAYICDFSSPVSRHTGLSPLTN